ncbi:MAG: bifunctional phosphopantothenoylcysteine decarboxylase/phosphopantothenate--cysteine ligase CoaBC [bacterium]
MTTRATILLGISGSIAAYKACDLIRLLREADCRVIPLLTPGASRFVTPLTVGVLAGETVYADYFDPKHNEGVDHIGLVQGADCFCVAPATANLIAKLALGIADDYPSLIGVAYPRPWVIAPAMNFRMYQNPVIQGHLDALRSRGARIVEPTTGSLACGEVGVGKLAPIEAIRDAILATLDTARSLTGLKVLITAGGTREPIDAVRYLGNRSSGQMGFALAEEAALRGAQVTLITTVAPPTLPATVTTVMVETTGELATALDQQASQHDIVIMAAAVADYTVTPVDGKLHRESEPSPSLTLTPTPDLLAGLVASKTATQTIVGFAAETGDLEARARAKFARKGCDLLIANDISLPGLGFGSPDNAVLVLTGPGPDEIHRLPTMSKRALAAPLWDLIRTTRDRTLRHSSTEGVTRHAVR